MLWIFLLLRRSYTSRTGVYPYDCQFGCAHCNFQCPARVFAEGFGTYTSRSGADYYGPQRAYEIAMNNYHAMVRALFGQAACPACGRFSPARTGLADHEGAARAESEDSRFTWAASVAGVLLLLSLGVAALDKSGWLAATGAGVALAIGLCVLLSKTPKIAGARLVHPPSVAFFTNGAWNTPQTTYLVPIDAKKARTSAFTAVTLLSATALAIGGIATFTAWCASFHTIHVVNTEARGLIHVRIDGKDVGDVAATTAANTDDASHTSFELRNGDHVLEVFAESGARIEKRDIEIDRFDSTTIYAPRAKENHACLGTITTSYQKYGDAPGPVVDIQDAPVIFTSFEDAFVRSPHTVMLDSNTSSSKRTAVRVFSCPGGHTSVPFSESLRKGNTPAEEDD